MGKGTLGKVGLILLTRKPAPTCALGFRVKTLKPSPWPGLHQQRIHREEEKGVKDWALSGEFVMALSRCPSRSVVPGPHSISVSPRGCSSRSCRAAQRCQSSMPTPGALGCAVPHCSNKFYSRLSPPPQRKYDPTPQSFKVGFSDYFAPTVISPESQCFSAVAHTLSP